jgi:hypothetical protein
MNFKVVSSRSKKTRVSLDSYTKDNSLSLNKLFTGILGRPGNRKVNLSFNWNQGVSPELFLSDQEGSIKFIISELGRGNYCLFPVENVFSTDQADMARTVVERIIGIPIKNILVDKLPFAARHQGDEVFDVEAVLLD